MIQLIFGKTIIKIPSEFNEVSLGKGVELIQYIQKDVITRNDKIVVISTLINAEPKLFRQVTDTTIDEVYNNLTFLKNDITDKIFFPSFKLNKIIYGFTDFSTLTVHEYADIEFYLTEGSFPLENLDKIISILYRPIINKKQSFKNILKNITLTILYKNFIPKIYNSYKIKDYSERSLLNAQMFSDKLSMDFGIAVFNYMNQLKQEIHDDYPTLFKQIISTEDSDQYDPPTNEPRPKTFAENWGLYHIVSTLSDSLFERDEWYKRPIRELFTYITYNNQRIELENQRILTNSSI